MRLTMTDRPYLSYGVVVLGTMVLWRLMAAPAGFRVFELTMFAAPGAVLALSARWASCVLRPERVTRRRMAHAAGVGALVLPPFIAFAIALLSALNGGEIVIIFVVGAWAALGGGLAIALFESLWRDFRPRRSAKRSHLSVFPFSPSRAPHLPSRVEPLLRWPESPAARSGGAKG